MKVFIDGKEGTTGLRIYERLAVRSDLTLYTLPEEQRKDPQARREALNAVDIAFLCLPDAAAREAVAMIENPHTRVIDASTAHRTALGWVYGFPELSAERSDAVRSAARVAVPGCHASGFIALVAPLVQAGILSREQALFCYSLTGYSGGGKKMIAEYEGQDRSSLLDAPRVYGLSQAHKHLPEMQALTGMAAPPVFCPVVGDFYSGMLVTVPLTAGMLQNRATDEDIRTVYRSLYTGPVVHYADAADENGFLSACAYTGRDDMEISVQGNRERIVLAARYDNLGKGASGAAVELLNLMTGAQQTEGLVLC